MKNVILTISLMLISYCLSAQNDEKAVELLDQTAAKIEKYNSLQLEFVMYVENSQSMKQESHSGKAIYKSGNYKLDLMGQIVFSDGKTNWTYLKDADEVNITLNSQAENMLDPKTLLKDYKDYYKIKYISDKFEKNRPLVEIDLYPIKFDDKKYSRIVLKIDKTKNQIYSAKYVGKDGVNYLIEINKFVENPSISDADIKYNDSSFPDAEIIDMRD
jgi:outer membrane lipoprotein-sorting protein